MVNKVMKVFYGENCLPYKDQERSVLFPILGNAFMGASNTTEIRFYIDKIGGVDSSWIVTAKLPNGKKGIELLYSDYDSELQENYVYFRLTSFYTQAKGELYITLAGYEGGVELEQDPDTGIYTLVGTPTIETTGSVKLNISYATLISGSDLGQEITLEGLLAEIGTKLDKTSPYTIKLINSIANINTTPSDEYLQNGSIVLDYGTYKLYELSGTYPTFTATYLLDLDESGVFSLTNISNGQVLSDDKLKEANRQYSVAIYDGIVFQKISGGIDMTFAQNWVVTQNNGVYTLSRTSFKISSTLGVISDSNFESYQVYSQAKVDDLLSGKADIVNVYSKTQADNKFQVKLVAGNGITIEGNTISATVPVESISNAEIDDIWGL